MKTLALICAVCSLAATVLSLSIAHIALAVVCGIVFCIYSAYLVTAE